MSGAGGSGGPAGAPGTGRGAAPGVDAAPVLEVRDLTTRFHTRSGTVHAVNGISWSLHRGESLGLVGESGSGKTVSALSLLGLVPHPGRIEAGQIRLRGSDLLGLSAAGWRRIRGRELAMVFQDPMTSLNPVLTVGRQITEVLEAHTDLDRSGARDEARRLLTRVGIPDAGRRVDAFPHEFSGGQRQRIGIAMALACRPAVLIADEPTTALDVTIQAQIVALVRELQEEMGMAVLWITHDLALAAGLVDRVAVMYAGRIVEEAPVRQLFRNPRHPYTRGLLGSLPDVAGGDPRQDPKDAATRSRTEAPASAPPSPMDDGGQDRPATRRLRTIPGRPPDLRTLPGRCDFAPRCPHASDLCWTEVPPLQAVAPDGAGHRSACWLWEEL